MKNVNLQSVKAAAEGVAAVAVLVAVLTIVGEMWFPLKDLLTNVFMHHWLGKSALSIAVFGVVYQMRKGEYARTDTTARSIYLAVILSFLATAALIVFFVLHSLGIV
ncbi:hypothetical protein CL652_02270 [bacterium]|nr:hypothetical protein [bacterium]|tara:strand:+ start:18443 stop:18763 length:321 start_codon:yes stop_codon:yes gene_type:complete